MRKQEVEWLKNWGGSPMSEKLGWRRWGTDWGLPWRPLSETPASGHLPASLAAKQY